MKGPKLENLMVEFIEGQFDLLVSTTIIENGVDVPNANTIIINQAQNFGLSDLHQMRGRVGRSNQKAFCFLISPPKHIISNESRKRLDALEQFSELGSGFKIAMRDLDIRGAGDLLGANQSGFINEIGFETYKKILNEAIQELKEKEFKAVFSEELKANTSFVKECLLETDLNLVIPDDYVNLISERINLYKTLDEAKSENVLSDFETTLVDRFGPIPNETAELIQTIRLRWLAKEIGFEKLILKRNVLIGTFVSNQKSPYYQSKQFSKILNYVQNQRIGSKMTEKNNKLRLRFENIQNIQQAIYQLKQLKN